MKNFILGYFIGGLLCSYVVLNITERGLKNIIERGVENVWIMYSIINSRNWIITRYFWCLFDIYVYERFVI